MSKWKAAQDSSKHFGGIFCPVFPWLVVSLLFGSFVT